MRELAVLRFGGETGAGRLLSAVREHEAAGRLRLADTAVVVKDEMEAVRVKGEVSGATERGAFVGGVLGTMTGTLGALILLALGVAGSPAGLLFVLLLPPILGAAGAAGGALAGWSLRAGIDRLVVRDVGVELPPRSSALILLIREAEPPIIDALRVAAETSGRVGLLPDATAALMAALGGPTQSENGEEGGEPARHRVGRARSPG